MAGRRGNRYKNGWSDEELLEELKRVDGVVDGAVTCDEFDENSDAAHTTLTRRFGSWNEAKELAGVEKGRIFRRGNDSKKNWVENYKSENSCQVCREGFEDCLVFHHVNGDEKDALVSRMKRTSYDEHTLQDVKDEVDKCVLLCANCHRKVHSERHDLSVSVK